MGAIVGALLGLRIDGEQEQEHSFGFSEAEIEQMGAGLDPAGGRVLSQDFLTPETVAAAEPKLAAMSAAIEQKQLS